MRKTILCAAIAALVGCVQPAFAARIYFNAAAFEPVETSTGVACEKASSASSTAWDHTWVEGTFDQSTDEACVFHFYWQSDMPQDQGEGLTVTGVYIDARSTTTGNVAFAVDLRCDTDFDGDLEAGTEKTSTEAIGTSYAMEALTTVVVPAYVATSNYCALSIRRDADNVADTLAADLLIRGVYIGY